MKSNLQRNISLSYLFRFLHTFTLADGIWVLFLLQKGLTLWQVGVLEGVFHGASFLTEIPSGAMADLLGRKRILILSRLCGMASTLLMLAADGMPLLAIAFVLNAWSYNLLSGSEEALVYDSFLGLNREGEYFRAAGRLNFIMEISQGTSVFLGGLIARISYPLCYLTSLFADVLATIVLLFMAEPQPDGERRCVTVREHFKISYAVIRADREVRYVLFHYAVLFAFYTSAFFYSQEFYFSRGFDELGIGLILLCAGAFSSAGALLSERLARKLGRRSCRAGGAAMALGLMLMSCRITGLSILGFGLNSFANAALAPLQSDELNRRIPSEQRATIISVSSMCFSAVMIVLFPLIGLFADSLGLTKILFLLGYLLLVYNHFASR